MAFLGWNALRDRVAALVDASEGDFQELCRKIGVLVQDCAKLAELLTDRKVTTPYRDLGGKPTVHDPMVCRGDKQGRSRLSPCADCMRWAFETLEAIYKIMDVELPEREELT